MNKLFELSFLKQLKGMGNATINKTYIAPLVQGQGIDELIEIIKEKSPRITKENIDSAKAAAYDQYNSFLADNGISVVTIFDDDYPAGLHDLQDKKPLILYVKGNKTALCHDAVAVIGTRKPSKWSECAEKGLVQTLTEISDYTIISGLALGCDKIAHQTALDYHAETVAVLPSGINVITPAQHKKLASDIITSGGCLVSEYLPDSKATRNTYIERDFVIAALTKATIVIECGVKSGTMHTVDAAQQMNRKLACYYPNDISKGDYEGNTFMHQEKGAVKLYGTAELNKFLKNMKIKPTIPESEQLSFFTDVNNNTVNVIANNTQRFIASI